MDQRADDKRQQSPAARIAGVSSSSRGHRAPALAEDHIDDLPGLHSQASLRNLGTRSDHIPAPPQFPLQQQPPRRPPSHSNIFPVDQHVYAGHAFQFHAPSPLPSQQNSFQYYPPNNDAHHRSIHTQTAPPRGSSLQPPQRNPQEQYSYVRGHDHEDRYTDRSWQWSHERAGQTWAPGEQDLEKSFSGPYDSGRHGDRGHAGSHGQVAAYAYANQHGDRQPLVHYVTNEWRRPARKGSYVYQRSYEDMDPDETWCDDCADICRSKVCKRILCAFVILMIILTFTWIRWLGPEMGDRGRLKDSVREALKKERGYFGIHQQMVFPGMKQIAELDRARVPGTGVRREGQGTRDSHRRLIIVGDIHGSIDELRALLKKVAFNPSADHLVTTGDMISRGPDSLEVISLLMSYNASCVRGDHEDRVLLAHRDLNAPSHRKAAMEGVTAVQPIKKGALSDLELADELDEQQLHYLRSCPLVLDAGPVSGLGHLAVTHAGLTPLLPLAEQDAFSVMTMRTIDLRNFLPSRYRPPPNAYDQNGKATGFRPHRKDEDRDRTGKSYGVAWPDLWDVAQGMVPSTERTTVVYGHDEDVGLTKGSWHYGLDGGCVLGGKLAALVLSGDWRGVSDVNAEVVTVNCRPYIGGSGRLPALGGS